MTTTLKVWSNPWHSVDHLGRPSGAATIATTPSDNTVRYIGAKLIVKAGPKAYDLRGTVDDVSFEFSDVVVELANGYDGYHRSLVKSGAVFAADQETADTCGVPFRPFADQIADAKEGANARWNKHHLKDMPGYVKPVKVASPTPAPASAIKAPSAATPVKESV